MKSIFFLLISFLICNFLFQCSKNVEAAFVCFEFDQRQCETDQWAEFVPSTESQPEREQKLKKYLVSAGMDINAVHLVLDFEGSGNCRACHICPTGDRFFVQINEDDIGKLEVLELLNLATVNCSDFF